MQIMNVRFGNAVLLGKACEPFFFISQGQRMDSSRLVIEPFDANFMRITFKHAAPERDYCQLVPWARVDTAMYTESAPSKEKDTSDLPDATPAKRGSKKA